MKADSVLGAKVAVYLRDIGMETPMSRSSIQGYDDNFKIKEIEFHFAKIMNALELDLTDDSLVDTPRRVAKMFVKEIFTGLNYENFPKITTIENKMDAGMVVEKNIKVMSNCEHHFVTIDGLACVAYIPSKKVIGLSKLNRVVNFFARRPQVQERLTNQIWHTLSYLLETEDIAVYLDATHFCVRSRGVEDSNSSTITSKLGGAFMNSPDTRAEFMSIARGAR
jgi:GTP cyclohydrolase I